MPGNGGRGNGGKGGKRPDVQAREEKKLIRMGAEEVVAAEHATEGKIGRNAGNGQKKS
jgi:hypothetical protein